MKIYIDILTYSHTLYPHPCISNAHMYNTENQTSFECSVGEVLGIPHPQMDEAPLITLLCDTESSPENGQEMSYTLLGDTDSFFQEENLNIGMIG